MKTIKSRIIGLLFLSLFFNIHAEAQCVFCSGGSASSTKSSSIVGLNNTASGYYSFAGGNSSTASGLNSFAFGNQVIASNDGAFASGFSSIASGILSFAFGNQVTAAGASSVAIGRFLQTATSPAFVLGCGFDLYNKLINDVPNSLMVGFNSNRSTLFVGPSVAANYTGKVGIGYFDNNSLPSTKLHIKADANEDASLKLEATGVGKSSVINFTDWHSLSASLNGNFNFNAPKGTNFIFKYGNMGIGDLTATRAKLHIKAGDTEDATLLLEATGTGKVSRIYFTDQHFIQAAPNDNFVFTSQATKNFIFRNGRMGIGTEAPEANLHVNGDVRFLEGNVNNQFQITQSTIAPSRRGISLPADPNGEFNFYIHGYQTNASFNFKNGLDNNTFLTIKNDGTVGIGTINTYGYKLAVAGKILATEVMIKHPDNWYDHVFESDYELISLTELEQYINKNKHLPDVPTEEVVMENGVPIGVLTGLLLKKIEELTLYAIQQQKLIEQQQKILEGLLIKAE